MADLRKCERCDAEIPSSIGPVCWGCLEAEDPEAFEQWLESDEAMAGTPDE